MEGTQVCQLLREIWPGTGASSCRAELTERGTVREPQVGGKKPADVSRDPE